MTHGEGAIAELKLQHGLNRARCRGTPKFQVQLTLAATALNLKRLARQSEAAAGGQTGASASAAAAIWHYELSLN
jgi:Transposase DDE domain